jgi:hypothetical protein
MIRKRDPSIAPGANPLGCACGIRPPAEIGGLCPVGACGNAGRVESSANTAIRAPHAGQNRLPSGTAPPHAGQGEVIGVSRPHRRLQGRVDRRGDPVNPSSLLGAGDDAVHDPLLTGHLDHPA